MRKKLSELTDDLSESLYIQIVYLDDLLTFCEPEEYQSLKEYRDELQKELDDLVELFLLEDVEDEDGREDN